MDKRKLTPIGRKKDRAKLHLQNHKSISCIWNGGEDVWFLNQASCVESVWQPVRPLMSSLPHCCIPLLPQKSGDVIVRERNRILSWWMLNTVEGVCAVLTCGDKRSDAYQITNAKSPLLPLIRSQDAGSQILPL